MLDSVRGKIGAAVAMMACCGLSMAIALGLIAFSSTLVIAGLAVAIAIGCVVFMLTFGHRHHHRAHAPASGRNNEPATH